MTPARKKVALVNPPWSFDGSVYFGCREPHLPLELGYAKALLERAGHEAEIIDGQLFGLTLEEVREQVGAFAPDLTVVTTAPSYLFWRCAPPELRVPMQTVAALKDVGGRMVGVGPHGSTTPKAALRKLGTEAVVMGECEEVLVRLADAEDWSGVQHVALWDGGDIRVNGGPAAATFTDLPALEWPEEWVKRHHHHHHRFDGAPTGPGAEMETSRGCPYSCTFCAKENFRDGYRKRPVPVVMEELDRLIAQGVEYVYFIDEIFLPNQPLLESLAERPITFGIQTRLDLWKPPMIELLGRAGCVSIEAGVESLTVEGRAALDKKCRMGTDELSERLILAKKVVPFVQANLILSEGDDPAMIAEWRDHMRANGVWANDPVPLFPYPGSPDYRLRWGLPDDQAWERAVDFYLTHHGRFCDIQDQTPKRLPELERIEPLPLKAAE
ncbi:TIGR04295 family B12-binding domain-containing radical SAM protein [Azospirillum rugosum]|uniref:B12-binding domain/radical SAM domain protein of rhizo-twelve system n=1 Tax=Azospirillum rugosum TaxID=416170 RepID=A0ABS4SPY9_9PROT|nr:TIGR04295 family B12-binding domain-containing radical SAM protein [Azospirillum rugosum]MBP2294628.1 B12-binding domain/radical SAM domain protein of rhizo-twelve system [Azospirillum rugosum]MDQ0528083.1 B12-binding domain/radical SAM domain protein of rhizo-twelve system [Azospirillum rugosum]